MLKCHTYGVIGAGVKAVGEQNKTVVRIRQKRFQGLEIIRFLLHFLLKGKLLKGKYELKIWVNSIIGIGVVGESQFDLS